MATLQKIASQAARLLEEAAARGVEKSVDDSAIRTEPAQSFQGQRGANAIGHIDRERVAVLNLNAALSGARGSLGQFVAQHEVAVASMQKFEAGVGRSITQAAVYGKSIRQAAMEAARATVESIAAKALVEAIYATAVGFLDLAEFNFGAAAQAFEAAAIFGTVGGAAAAIGGAIPSAMGSRVSGGGRSGYHAAGGSQSGAYQAQASDRGISFALAAGAQPSIQPLGGLTVAIMGNEEAGQWLATTLNKAVTQQGVQLVSSSSQRGAPVGH